MKNTIDNKGYLSPKPAMNVSNYTESPALATLVTPAKDGARTFYYQNKQKTLGYTPQQENVLKINQNQIGTSHLITNPLYTKLYITDETLWNEESMLDFDKQHTQLLTQLLSLKKRSDKDYNFKIRDGSFSPRHINAAKIKISSCIIKLNICMDIAPDLDGFLETLNQRIQDKNFYNPFGLKKIYKENSFDLDLANDEEITYAMLKPKHIATSSSSNAVSGSSNLGFFSTSTICAPMVSSTIHSCKLMMPSSVLKAKRKKNDESNDATSKNTKSFSSTKTSP